MKKIIEISLILIVFILVNIQSIFYQSQISYNNGQGWDGVEYYKTAQAFKDNIKPLAKAPFVYRIGTPYLAQLTSPSDINFGFKSINIFANIIVLLLFYFIISYFSNNSFLKIIFPIFYIIQFLGPIRFTYYYPIHSDSIALIFLFGGILIQLKEIKNQYIYLSILGFVGIYFREIAIIPSLVFMLMNLKNNNYKKIEFKNYFPFLMVFASMFSIKLIASQSNTYQSYNAAFDYLYNKSIIMYIHSILIAFGPILLVLLYLKIRNKFYYDIEKKNVIKLYIYLLFILAFIGGSDTERLVYWSAPFVFGFIAFQIDKNILLNHNKFLISILILLQIYSSRIFFIIPDYPSNLPHIYPFLTQFGNNFQYLDLFAFHSDNKVRLVGFVSYLILAILISIYALYENKIGNKDIN